MGDVGLLSLTEKDKAISYYCLSRSVYLWQEYAISGTLVGHTNRCGGVTNKPTPLNGVEGV